jgi:hypothetical protein
MPASAASFAGPEFIAHDFRWVCSALASPRFAPPRLPLVDTIIIERGRPSLWLSLEPDGELLTRPVGASASQDIFNAFCAFSSGFARNRRGPTKACVVHYSVGLPQVRLGGSRASAGMWAAAAEGACPAPLASAAEAAARGAARASLRCRRLI